MARKIRPATALYLSGLQTHRLAGRSTKVRAENFKPPYRPGGSFGDFTVSLPECLHAADLKALAAVIARAHGEDRVVALGLGAHNIKVGLQPLYADLMDRGVITSVALNGAGIVHDFELAFAGHTSEDVGTQLRAAPCSVTLYVLPLK